MIILLRLLKIKWKSIIFLSISHTLCYRFLRFFVLFLTKFLVQSPLVFVMYYFLLSHSVDSFRFCVVLFLTKFCVFLLFDTSQRLCVGCLLFVLNTSPNTFTSCFIYTKQYRLINLTFFLL